jgi:hypothetical protein
MTTETESNFIIKGIKSLFNYNIDTEGGSDLVNKLHNLNNSLSGGNVYLDNSVFLPPTTQYVPTRDELLATETVNMMGGSNIIKGIRNENLLGVVSEGGGPDDDELMYGGRNKPSPGDEIHQQALDYLKDDLKLEPLEARAYKSLAYQEVKENNPDVTSLERAKLMLALVKSEQFLDKFKEKLDERMDLIKTKDQEREKRLSESEPASESEEKVKKSSKKSKKSKDTQEGGFFSETSVNLNFTETNNNIPYYKEYMAAKQQYLQAKNLQNGGDIINFKSLSDLRSYLDKNE